MAYTVISIGKEFTPKSIQHLQATLNRIEGEGWEFVFAFPVVQRTCIFFRQETYLMVLQRKNAAP